MIDYHSITGRAQEHVNTIYQAADMRDLATIATTQETIQPTHNGWHIPTISHMKHSIILGLASVRQAWWVRAHE